MNYFVRLRVMKDISYAIYVFFLNAYVLQDGYVLNVLRNKYIIIMMEFMGLVIIGQKTNL